ncbi:hypothetical protein ALI144C_30795 [Actinosynnema sp. ALI-1.44]|uniref:tRNA-dependent cyclodipeptide synthase n=1 Tax=Actinosynnema sp. ALI-1.44 TaxID=1933779 RepID=UPI00097BD775|nr:tRNA-dependent cyclodipeptide synthase [Actinosynnema sp. ALI-1.44]ONI77823.1 hypothetical protein ALI144C_30795 [Actinosynnema sp. ALI-1.44]
MTGNNELGTAAFTATPLSANCRAVYERREHALIGLSPGSGYFSTGRIGQLAQIAATEFERFHFMILAEPFTWNLQAIGHTPTEAAKLGYQQQRRLINRANRALAEAGATDNGNYILQWADLCDNREYVEILGNVYESYNAMEDFRVAASGIAADYVRTRNLQGRRPFAERVSFAVHYFLAELPLLLDTPHILGLRSSVFCYHRTNEFIDKLWTGQLPVAPADNQGYLVLTLPYPAKSSVADPEATSPDS